MLPDIEKYWLQSRGVIGSLISAATGVAIAFGALTPDQAADVTSTGEAVVAHIDQLVLALTATLGGLVGLWGRVRAEAPIARRLLPRA